ncbi:ATPase subunit 1 [Tanacetum coccineum]
MEFSLRAVELTTLLESRISNFYMKFQVDEIGRVVSVRYGIARVYGLNKIQSGEMVEFASGMKGIALNLENKNVGIIVFGSDTAIKEGDFVKCTGSIMDIPAGKAMLGHVVDSLGVPIDGRGALSDHDLVPIGCGNRELIIRDRQTGKIAIVDFPAGKGRYQLMSLKTVRDMEGCFGFYLRWVHVRLGAVAKARFDTHHLEEYAQTSAALEKATSALDQLEGELSRRSETAFAHLVNNFLLALT